MPTMNVSLPQALADFVDKEVTVGDYGSASEVVREGLRLLRREKALEREKLDILRREVAVGVEQAKSGKFSKRSVSDIAAAVTRERCR